MRDFHFEYDFIYKKGLLLYVSSSNLIRSTYFVLILLSLFFALLIFIYWVYKICLILQVNLVVHFLVMLLISNWIICRNYLQKVPEAKEVAGAVPLMTVFPMMFVVQDRVRHVQDLSKFIFFWIMHPTKWLGALSKRNTPITHYSLLDNAPN